MKIFFLAFFSLMLSVAAFAQEKASIWFTLGEAKPVELFYIKGHDLDRADGSDHYMVELLSKEMGVPLSRAFVEAARKSGNSFVLDALVVFKDETGDVIKSFKFVDFEFVENGLNSETMSEWVTAKAQKIIPTGK